MLYWFVECLICDNLDETFGKCRKALVKPDQDAEGVCEYFDQEVT